MPSGSSAGVSLIVACRWATTVKVCLWAVTRPSGFLAWRALRVCLGGGEAAESWNGDSQARVIMWAPSLEGECWKLSRVNGDSYERHRGQRRRKGREDTPWQPPKRNMGGVDSSDSKGTRSISTRMRDRREDPDAVTMENHLCADNETRSESPHPLVEAITCLETDKEALGANGGGETEEAAL
ncbi:hypothetical protein NDU88_004702 [Pleurodeles waltl]|uniref:Uncharacterized protein n=1 Tax=Pleurodeles waltl TaxID=8319 RepID=A0AAV7QDR1_PLEWA|nr:hypothetical protein NDU88_004702 [Pleurodeles waltl]